MENNEPNKNQAKKTVAFVVEIVKIALFAIVIVIPIRYFLFQPFFVRGQSMDPTFENGDYLIIDEITYRFRNPERGEVIVFKAPQDPSQRYIKRLIGLPSETVKIEEGQIYIYNEQGEMVLNESEYLSGVETAGNIDVKLKENEYFVLGDNRPFSFDSRRFGPVGRDNIIGRVALRAWPFGSMTTFEAPEY